RVRDLKLDSRTHKENAIALQVMGAALLRGGQFKEALQPLHAASAMSTSSLLFSAELDYLLAITHERLSHHADAKLCLTRADAEADSELNAAGNSSTWPVRLSLSLLKREAHEVIDLGGSDRPRRDK